MQVVTPSNRPTHLPRARQPPTHPPDLRAQGDREKGGEAAPPRAHHTLTADLLRKGWGEGERQRNRRLEGDRDWVTAPGGDEEPRGAALACVCVCEGGRRQARDELPLLLRTCAQHERRKKVEASEPGGGALAPTD